MLMKKFGELNSRTEFAHDHWGIDNDFAKLTDVLLGRPEYYRWVDAGPLIRRTMDNAERTGITFDFELSQRQHAEMVRQYEAHGVTCHFLDAGPAGEKQSGTADCHHCQRTQNSRPPVPRLGSDDSRWQPAQLQVLQNVHRT